MVNEVLVAAGMVLLAIAMPLKVIVSYFAPSPEEIDPENPARAERIYERRNALAAAIPSFLGGIIAAAGIASI